MNERIKELAEQCYHRYSEYNIDLEKFAELLIRECVGVVNANMDDILDQPVFNPTDEIWNRARVEELVRVALHIKKHFGVEE